MDQRITVSGSKPSEPELTRNPRDLPQIDALLNLATIQNAVQQFSHDEVVKTLRSQLGAIRQAILAGDDSEMPDFDSRDFAQSLTKAIQAQRTPALRPVINATGIIIHTNLGRANLAPEAIEAMQTIAAAPSNLELNVVTGKRGSRYANVESLICELTGAEAALVVNNCAAAVLLSLMGTANGKSVVASRGELIEIGGSFRMPDVIQQSGASLTEVGTTNKTRIDDYADAIGPDTAVLLKSHTSNFRIVGFTSSPARRDLAYLAKSRGVILIEDLGSGVLIDLSPYGLADEPVVSDILKSGVDLVMFSGDKLLGGPQAGIIAGRADIVAGLKRHPLLRALRIDKLSLAALEATLRLYRPPFDPLRRIPVLQMLSDPIENIRQRAGSLAKALQDTANLDTDVITSAAYVGGGSLPQQDLHSFAVSLAVKGLSAETLAAQLRQGPTPVIGRIAQDRVVLDVRTVIDADLPAIVQSLQSICSK